MLVRGGIVVAVLVLAACGAGSGEGLDVNGRPLAPGGASALVPTFSSIQDHVFTPICAVPGCHGGASAQYGLRLDPGFSYGNLVNVASGQDANQTRVIPGDPNDSLIIHKLEGTQTVGARMPDFGPYLPQSTIDVIRQWILDGALQ